MSRRPGQRNRIQVLTCNICGAPAVKPGRRCEVHRFRRKCLTCGESFFPHDTGSGKRYCSTECAERIQICDCGTVFVFDIRVDHRAKYCSAECRKRAGVRQIRERYAEGKVKACIRCGVELPWGGFRQMCDECRKGRSARSNARRGTSFASRARYHGVEYVKIRPIDIYRRDKWICGICGKPVDPQLKWPQSSMCATLDHVIPMALGGGHVPRNVQCAHFRCNSRKGTRLLVPKSWDATRDDEAA